MQNAGLQYGQGVNPLQDSPFGTTPMQNAVPPTSSTSSLRQFRKKDVEKTPVAAEVANSSHVARVAPHNHYPHKQNDYFRYAPSEQYHEYSLPYKEHTVKYSEIAEPPLHLDIHKQKEKEYVDMCNIPQQPHLAKPYQEHQFNPQQSYPPEIALHHQYMHKDHQTSQMHPPYKPDTQCIPKDSSAFNHQISPFLKYNIPQSRNYHLENSSIPSAFQRMDPHLARTLMADPHHPHHFSAAPTGGGAVADYPSMDQSRMYAQKQRYYQPTNAAYNYSTHRNIPAQQYNYASCNYPRGNQMGRYMERSVSPNRRAYQDNLEMGVNFGQKIPTGYAPNYPAYSQHYQHRRPPHPQEYYHPQQHRPHPQYLPSHLPQEVPDNHAVASNNIRQYLENWAEEESTADIPAPIDKYIPRMNRDETNEVYVINASELPQYLEGGVPLVTSENGQYIFKSNVSIDNNGAIKIIDKDPVATETTTSEPQERVVSLHIIEDPKETTTKVTNDPNNFDLSTTNPKLPSTTQNYEGSMNLSQKPATEDKNQPSYEPPPVVPRLNFDDALLAPTCDPKENEERRSILNEELDKIVEDTLTSSNIDIPVHHPPKIQGECDDECRIPDDLNLDLATTTKEVEIEEIMDLSVSSRRDQPNKEADEESSSSQKSVKDMPLIEEQPSQPTPETETNEDEKKSDDSTATNDEAENTEEKQKEEEPQPELKQNENVTQEPDNMPILKKKDCGRKKRIFSVDDIIYRIGGGTILNRRYSLNFFQEDGAALNGDDLDLKERAEEDCSKTVKEVDIETFLPAHPDVVSIDRSAEFQSCSETKLAEMETRKAAETVAITRESVIQKSVQTEEAQDTKEDTVVAPSSTEPEATLPSDNIVNTETDKEKKQDLTFEEKFILPYCENVDGQDKSEEEEVQYRSVLKIEENNVLLEIAGELVEINVNMVNGRNVITVIPISDAVVDLNDNYEQVDRTLIAEETHDDLKKTPDVEVGTIEEIIEETILNENEIIIGDDSLEQEINLDLLKNEDVEASPKPALCTKASKKLYDDALATTAQKTYSNVKRLRRVKPQRDYTTEKRLPTKRRKVPDAIKEETKADLKEIIKKRNLRKERIKLNYKDHVKKTTTKKVGPTKKPVDSVAKKPPKVEEKPSSTSENFPLVRLSPTTTDATPHTDNPQPKFPPASTPRDPPLAKNINEHYLSRKDHSNLKKKLSIQEYNSRKRKSVEGGKGDATTEKVAKIEPPPTTPIQKETPLIQQTKGVQQGTIYSDRQFEYAPNGSKDPRRRAPFYNGMMGYNTTRAYSERYPTHYTVNTSVQRPRLSEPSSSVPPTFTSPTTKESSSRETFEYKKLTIEKHVPRSQRITGRRKTIEGLYHGVHNSNDQSNRKKVTFDDHIQINEIHTTQSKTVKSRPDTGCCEVSSSSTDVFEEGNHPQPSLTSLKLTEKNSWEDSNSPIGRRNSADDALDQEKTIEENLQRSKNTRSIIDMNDFDTTHMVNELRSPPSGGARPENDKGLKNYKDEVDSKLNSLNIQIPKTGKRPSEDDVLMHKFLRREKLNADEIKQIRRIIYLKKKIQQLAKENPKTENDNYVIQPSPACQTDLKLQFKRAEGKKRRKKRFRNLYSDSPETSESEFQESAGEFFVCEGENISGVKLILKRKTDLLHLQPVVKLQRCTHIELMAKKLEFG